MYLILFFLAFYLSTNNIDVLKYYNPMKLKRSMTSTNIKPIFNLMDIVSEITYYLRIHFEWVMSCFPLNNN
jgi:hypothetical protein